MGIKVVVNNKKAFRDYAISDKYEAGIVLFGTEVKSIRAGKISLADGWVDLTSSEPILKNVSIAPYTHGNRMNHEQMREKKLLLNKKELKKIGRDILEKGFTLIPLKVYFKKSLVKVEIGLAKGKKHYDKREDEKKRQSNRDIDRAFKANR